MACKRMGYRELRREEAFHKYKEKRQVLLDIIKNKGGQHDWDEMNSARAQLKKLPRDASKVRQRNRCEYKQGKKQCGRPRGVLRKFKLCRIHLRELGMLGFLAGLKKSSW